MAQVTYEVTYRDGRNPERFECADEMLVLTELLDQTPFAAQLTLLDGSVIAIKASDARRIKKI